MSDTTVGATDIKCPECDHNIDMHVTGATPRYAGCMVREPRGPAGKMRTCWCALTPAAARLATKEDQKHRWPPMVPENSDTGVCADCEEPWPCRAALATKETP